MPFFTVFCGSLEISKDIDALVMKRDSLGEQYTNCLAEIDKLDAMERIEIEVVKASYGRLIDDEIIRLRARSEMYNNVSRKIVATGYLCGLYGYININDNFYHDLS